MSITNIGDPFSDSYFLSKIRESRNNNPTGLKDISNNISLFILNSPTSNNQINRDQLRKHNILLDLEKSLTSINSEDDISDLLNDNNLPSSMHDIRLFKNNVMYENYGIYYPHIKKLIKYLSDTDSQTEEITQRFIKNILNKFSWVRVIILYIITNIDAYLNNEKDPVLCPFIITSGILQKFERLTNEKINIIILNVFRDYLSFRNDPLTLVSKIYDYVLDALGVYNIRNYNQNYKNTLASLNRRKIRDILQDDYKSRVGFFTTVLYWFLDDKSIVFNCFDEGMSLPPPPPPPPPPPIRIPPTPVPLQRDIPGCTDPNAQNYDRFANEDDGSCIYPGCTDPNAQNYDRFANEDDGSCIYPGCTDPNALNYDPNANEDDGSCIYPSVDNGVVNAFVRPGPPPVPPLKVAQPIAQPVAQPLYVTIPVKIPVKTPVKIPVSQPVAEPEEESESESVKTPVKTPVKITQPVKVSQPEAESESESVQTPVKTPVKITQPVKVSQPEAESEPQPIDPIEVTITTNVVNSFITPVPGPEPEPIRDEQQDISEPVEVTPLTFIPQPVIPQPVIPRTVIPRTVIPQPVIPQPVVDDELEDVRPEPLPVIPYPVVDDDELEDVRPEPLPVIPQPVVDDDRLVDVGPESGAVTPRPVGPVDVDPQEISIGEVVQPDQQVEDPDIPVGTVLSEEPANIDYEALGAALMPQQERKFGAPEYNIGQVVASPEQELVTASTGGQRERVAVNGNRGSSPSWSSPDYNPWEDIQRNLRDLKLPATINTAEVIDAWREGKDLTSMGLSEKQDREIRNYLSSQASSDIQGKQGKPSPFLRPVLQSADDWMDSPGLTTRRELPLNTLGSGENPMTLDRLNYGDPVQPESPTTIRDGKIIRSEDADVKPYERRTNIGRMSDFGKPPEEEEGDLVVEKDGKVVHLGKKTHNPEDEMRAAKLLDDFKKTADSTGRGKFETEGGTAGTTGKIKANDLADVMGYTLAGILGGEGKDDIAKLKESTPVTTYERRKAEGDLKYGPGTKEATEYARSTASDDHIENLKKLLSSGKLSRPEIAEKQTEIYMDAFNKAAKSGSSIEDAMRSILPEGMHDKLPQYIPFSNPSESLDSFRRGSSKNYDFIEGIARQAGELVARKAPDKAPIDSKSSSKDLSKGEEPTGFQGTGKVSGLKEPKSPMENRALDALEDITGNTTRPVFSPEPMNEAEKAARERKMGPEYKTLGNSQTQRKKLDDKAIEVEAAHAARVKSGEDLTRKNLEKKKMEKEERDAQREKISVQGEVRELTNWIRDNETKVGTGGVTLEHIREKLEEALDKEYQVDSKIREIERKLGRITAATADAEIEYQSNVRKQEKAEQEQQQLINSGDYVGIFDPDFLKPESPKFVTSLMNRFLGDPEDERKAKELKEREEERQAERVKEVDKMEDEVDGRRNQLDEMEKEKRDRLAREVMVQEIVDKDPTTREYQAELAKELRLNPDGTLLSTQPLPEVKPTRRDDKTSKRSPIWPKPSKGDPDESDKKGKKETGGEKFSRLQKELEDKGVPYEDRAGTIDGMKKQLDGLKGVPKKRSKKKPHEKNRALPENILDGDIKAPEPTQAEPVSPKSEELLRLMGARNERFKRNSLRGAIRVKKLDAKIDALKGGITESDNLIRELVEQVSQNPSDEYLKSRLSGANKQKEDYLKKLAATENFKREFVLRNDGKDGKDGKTHTLSQSRRLNRAKAAADKKKKELEKGIQSMRSSNPVQGEVEQAVANLRGTVDIDGALKSFKGLSRNKLEKYMESHGFETKKDENIEILRNRAQEVATTKNKFYESFTDGGNSNLSKDDLQKIARDLGISSRGDPIRLQERIGKKLNPSEAYVDLEGKTTGGKEAPSSTKGKKESVKKAAEKRSKKSESNQRGIGEIGSTGEEAGLALARMWAKKDAEQARVKIAGEERNREGYLETLKKAGVNFDPNEDIYKLKRQVKEVEDGKRSNEYKKYLKGKGVEISPDTGVDRLGKQARAHGFVEDDKKGIKGRLRKDERSQARRKARVEKEKAEYEEYLKGKGVEISPDAEIRVLRKQAEDHGYKKVETVRADKLGKMINSLKSTGLSTEGTVKDIQDRYNLNIDKIAGVVAQKKQTAKAKRDAKEAKKQKRAESNAKSLKKTPFDRKISEAVGDVLGKTNAELAGVKLKKGEQHNISAKELAKLQRDAILEKLGGDNLTNEQKQTIERHLNDETVKRALVSEEERAKARKERHKNSLKKKSKKSETTTPGNTSLNDALQALGKEGRKAAGEYEGRKRRTGTPDVHNGVPEFDNLEAIYDDADYRAKGKKPPGERSVTPKSSSRLTAEMQEIEKKRKSLLDRMSSTNRKQYSTKKGIQQLDKFISDNPKAVNKALSDINNDLSLPGGKVYIYKSPEIQDRRNAREQKDRRKRAQEDAKKSEQTAEDIATRAAATVVGTSDERKEARKRFKKSLESGNPEDKKKIKSIAFGNAVRGKGNSRVMEVDGFKFTAVSNEEKEAQQINAKNKVDSVEREEKKQAQYEKDVQSRKDNTKRGEFRQAIDEKKENRKEVARLKRTADSLGRQIKGTTDGRRKEQLNKEWAIVSGKIEKEVSKGKRLNEKIKGLKGVLSPSENKTEVTPTGAAVGPYEKGQNMTPFIMPPKQSKTKSGKKKGKKTQAFMKKLEKKTEEMDRKKYGIQNIKRQIAEGYDHKENREELRRLQMGVRSDRKELKELTEVLTSKGLKREQREERKTFETQKAKLDDAYERDTGKKPKSLKQVLSHKFERKEDKSLQTSALDTQKSMKKRGIQIGIRKQIDRDEANQLLEKHVDYLNDTERELEERKRKNEEQLRILNQNQKAQDRIDEIIEDKEAIKAQIAEEKAEAKRKKGVSKLSPEEQKTIVDKFTSQIDALNTELTQQRGVIDPNVRENTGTLREKINEDEKRLNALEKERSKAVGVARGKSEKKLDSLTRDLQKQSDKQERNERLLAKLQKKKDKIKENATLRKEKAKRNKKQKQGGDNLTEAEQKTIVERDQLALRELNMSIKSVEDDIDKNEKKMKTTIDNIDRFKREKHKAFQEQINSGTYKAENAGELSSDIPKERTKGLLMGTSSNDLADLNDSETGIVGVLFPEENPDQDTKVAVDKKSEKAAAAKEENAEEAAERRAEAGEENAKKKTAEKEEKAEEAAAEEEKEIKEAEAKKKREAEKEKKAEEAVAEEEKEIKEAEAKKKREAEKEKKDAEAAEAAERRAAEKEENAKKKAEAKEEKERRREEEKEKRTKKADAAKEKKAEEAAEAAERRAAAKEEKAAKAAEAAERRSAAKEEKAAKAAEASERRSAAKEEKAKKKAIAEEEKAVEAAEAVEGRAAAKEEKAKKKAAAKEEKAKKKAAAEEEKAKKKAAAKEEKAKKKAAAEEERDSETRKLSEIRAKERREIWGLSSTATEEEVRQAGAKKVHSDLYKKQMEKEKMMTPEKMRDRMKTVRENKQKREAGTVKAMETLEREEMEARREMKRSEMRRKAANGGESEKSKAKTEDKSVDPLRYSPNSMNSRMSKYKEWRKTQSGQKKKAEEEKKKKWESQEQAKQLRELGYPEQAVNAMAQTRGLETPKSLRAGVESVTDDDSDGTKKVRIKQNTRLQKRLSELEAFERTGGLYGDTTSGQTRGEDYSDSYDRFAMHEEPDDYWRKSGQPASQKKGLSGDLRSRISGLTFADIQKARGEAATKMAAKKFGPNAGPSGVDKATEYRSLTGKERAEMRAAEGKAVHGGGKNRSYNKNKIAKSYKKNKIAKSYKKNKIAKSHKKNKIAKSHKKKKSRRYGTKRKICNRSICLEISV